MSVLCNNYLDFMFTRKILSDLRNWAQVQNRKPVIIRGARQVGKTSAINIFSKEFDQYINLNLELKRDRDLFERDLSIEDLFQAILLKSNITKTAGNASGIQDAIADPFENGIDFKRKSPAAEGVQLNHKKIRGFLLVSVKQDLTPLAFYLLNRLADLPALEPLEFRVHYQAGQLHFTYMLRQGDIDFGTAGDQCHLMVRKRPA